MAKYIVEDIKTRKFEKDYKFPLINLIPAIIWSIPVYQKVSPIFGMLGAYGAGAAFIILFMALSYMPFGAAVPGGGRNHYTDGDVVGTGGSYRK